MTIRKIYEGNKKESRKYFECPFSKFANGIVLIFLGLERLFAVREGVGVSKT
jgi:hypothetical protein